MSQLMSRIKQSNSIDPIDMWLKEAPQLEEKNMPKDPLKFWIGKSQGTDQFKCISQMALDIFSIPGINKLCALINTIQLLLWM